jgi:parvulin-like peptidyl-prolyl isomerase
MHKLSISAFLLAGAVSAVFAGELPPDTPLIVSKDATLKAVDFEAAMARVPERHRAPLRMSQEKVSTMVDGLFIGKALAAKARQAGIDKDPLVRERLELAQVQVLADLYLQKVEKEAKVPSFEQRARELYNSDLKRYQVGEQVNVQQILISYNERTPEMALARANEVAAEVRTKDFLEVARDVTEDPDKRRNFGNLGWNSAESFDPAIAAWLKSAKEKNTVSPPIRTRFGYHLVKFVDRQPPRQRSFEEVKKDIIEDQRANFMKQVREQAVNAIRNDPSVVVHAANVEALKVEVDPALLTRIQQEGK